jgi:hypothetical protein
MPFMQFHNLTALKWYVNQAIKQLFAEGAVIIGHQYKFCISNELSRVLIGQLTSKSDALFTT